MSQFPDVNVSVAEAPNAPLPPARTWYRALDPEVAATVTFAVGSLSSSTVNESVGPPSVTAVEPPLSVAVKPAVSSSAIVSVTDCGFSAPVPEALPDTVTVLSAASTSLFTAVTVTISVLVVAPVAIVSRRFALSW